jgi:GTP-binding protein
MILPVPIVALVGRPNVGKSTLFNRLVGGRKAIEEKIPGITRDRLYGRSSWLNREFLVIDTGGLTFPGGDGLEAQVQRQALLALEESTVVVFLVDGRQGLTPLDEEIAALLHRQGKPVLLVVNKIESPAQSVVEFYKLGFNEPLPISAAHGLNIGELLDEIISFFPAGKGGKIPAEEAIRIAVVGRPNVGKSSLINTLLGEERVIVSQEPGTTRDAIDTLVEREGKKYIFVDTAGIRRKSRVSENIEYYSVLRALKALDSADLALLLLEAPEGVTEQDQRIAGYILESGKALIISLNKWDLVQKTGQEGFVEEMVTSTREALKFVSFAPLIFTSIYTPHRLKHLFNLFPKVYENHSRRIPTGLLNEILLEAQGINPLPTVKGKRGRIYYWTQSSIRPPTFVLFVNNPALIHFSYLRYLENRLREAFDFEGTSLKLLLRARRRRKGER